MTVKTIILIPSYNGKKFLDECLESVLNQSALNFKAVLIDDGSTDDTIEYVKKNFSQVDILALNKNCGFARAINEGIKYCLAKYDPDYIALLNNDTRVDWDWLASLLSALDGQPNIAAAASNMLFYDRPDIINSQGGTCSIWGHGQDINVNKKISEVDLKPGFILSPCFGAALLRVKSLKDIGLLDERYFAYYEDLDWGWRANIMGYKIIFEPRAIVYHYGSGTWGDRTFEKDYLCLRNALCTIIKNYEFKNILRVLISGGLFFYLRISFDYLNNLRIKKGKIIVIYQEITLKKRLKLALLPFKITAWNLKNLKETIALRKTVQTKRRVNDREISRYFKNRLNKS